MTGLLGRGGPSRRSWSLRMLWRTVGVNVGPAARLHCEIHGESEKEQAPTTCCFRRAFQGCQVSLSMALDLFLDAFHERMDRGPRSGHRFILNRHGSAASYPSIRPRRWSSDHPIKAATQRASLVVPPLTLCGRDV
ncbi:hypothetical protein VTN00DRAFT_7901 [Thermoascus crustaceus]|uniref:uncharacterized protein n=1 Tax=Thermoascus crustaceus TaxID=5088 RepID=UPI003743FC02